MRYVSLHLIVISSNLRTHCSPDPRLLAYILQTDGDQNHFPVYEQSEETLAAIEKDYIEATKDPIQHYDASKDNRTIGAGFYKFSKDEEERMKEMEDLKRRREETVGRRKEEGVDVVQDGGVEEGVERKITGKGMDKRKRELEERRKALEAKRRKKNPDSILSSVPTPTPPPTNSSVTETSRPKTTTTATASTPSADLPPPPHLPSTKPPAFVTVAADDFLANLEADLLKK